MALSSAETALLPLDQFLILSMGKADIQCTISQLPLELQASMMEEQEYLWQELGSVWLIVELTNFIIHIWDSVVSAFYTILTVQFAQTEP